MQSQSKWRTWTYQVHVMLLARSRALSHVCSVRPTFESFLSVPQLNTSMSQPAVQTADLEKGGNTGIVLNNLTFAELINKY